MVAMKFLMLLIRLSFPFIYMLLAMQFVFLMFEPSSSGGENLYKVLAPVLPVFEGITTVLAFPMLLLCKGIGMLLPEALWGWFPVADVGTVFIALGVAIMALPMMDHLGRPFTTFDYEGVFGGGFHWAYLLAIWMWRMAEKPVEKLFLAAETAGFEVKRRETSEKLLKRFERGEHIPKAGKEQQQTVSVILEPKKKQEFREVVDTLKGEVSGLKERVNTDPLTKLYNKAYFNNTLAREVEILRPMQGILAVAIIDIDDFKKLNDTYGHPQGDKILIAVAAQLQALRVRSGTIVPCRIGGEELGLIFIGVDAAEAGRVAESFRQNVENLRFPHPSHPDGNIRVTVSTGLLTVRFNESTESALLRPSDMSQRADEMLYRSKAEGKNRVSVWTVE